MREKSLSNMDNSQSIIFEFNNDSQADRNLITLVFYFSNIWHVEFDNDAVRL